VTHEVIVSADASADLVEIVNWIADHDSPAKAEQVLARIQSTLATLSRFPHRGAHPRELLALGIRDYRETAFKPYRIVYYLEARRVIVVLIADGRRDMQALLARRLLGA